MTLPSGQIPRWKDFSSSGRAEISGEVHLQHRAGSAADFAANGFVPQALASFKSVAARKAVVFSLYFQNVYGLLQSDGLDGLHQGGYFALVVLSRQGAANSPDGYFFYPHCVSLFDFSFNHTHNDFELLEKVKKS